MQTIFILFRPDLWRQPFIFLLRCLLNLVKTSLGKGHLKLLNIKSVLSSKIIYLTCHNYCDRRFKIYKMHVDV